MYPLVVLPYSPDPESTTTHSFPQPKKNELFELFIRKMMLSLSSTSDEDIGKRKTRDREEENLKPQG